MLPEPLSPDSPAEPPSPGILLPPPPPPEYPSPPSSDDAELPLETGEQNSNRNEPIESFKFKQIQFGNDDQMRLDVQSLSYEQRLAFEVVIQLCKKKKIQRARPSFIVPPERFIVTGKQVIYTC